MQAIEFKVKWGMLVDLDKCTGCGACTVACRAENNLPPEADAANKLRTNDWMNIYELSNEKPFPDHEVAYLPRPCMQCGHPSCSTVCPVVATTKDEEGGIVSQVYPRCIGCRYCMAGCPYGSRSFNFKDPRPHIEKIDLDYPTRTKGVVEKCEFCAERLAEGKLPSCVEVSEGAISFGDLDDPESEVRKLLSERFSIRRSPYLGTKPCVYYLV